MEVPFPLQVGGPLAESLPVALNRFYRFEEEICSISDLYQVKLCCFVSKFNHMAAEPRSHTVGCSQLLPEENKGRLRFLGMRFFSDSPVLRSGPAENIEISKYGWIRMTFTKVEVSPQA